jgi:pimeloyl-ACP methyl ester carboxylesterase
VLAALSLAASFFAATLAGCGFRALGRNLRTLDQNGFVRGTVETTGGAPAAQLVVFAVRVGDERGEAADWGVLARPGPFLLVVPVGEYRIGAFEDRNRSLSYDAGEPAGWAHDAGPVEVEPGATSSELRLVLDGGAGAPAITVTLPARGAPRVDRLPAGRVGELVMLDDARFSDESGKLGLWKPVDFLVDVGAGIYFLEPYDPARTPVLFVHGAVGHPGVFRTLAASLDQRRFQAWFAYYPSAVSLGIVGAALDRWLQALEVEYHFHRLVVVAHSMGGLVARAYIGADPDGLGGTLESLTFVSIATPWQGHAMAARGVERAPVVAPSWFDMAPDSPFLAALLANPLPPHAVHDLYFAYGGSRLRREANDGVVTLASQLEPRAQRQARRVIGFNAGHRAVLDSPAVVEELRRSLADVEPLG